MTEIKTKVCPAYEVKIFIAGNYELAKQYLAQYCTDIGFCVSVNPTDYIYRYGQEQGMVITVINYARFEVNAVVLWAQAESIGLGLLDVLNQGSFTIQDHKTSKFYSRRGDI